MIDISKYIEVFSKFHNKSVLVIGDLMLDEYIYGDINRISPEASVHVVNIQNRKISLGGAGNVVKNLTCLGAKVFVISVVDNKDTGCNIINEIKRLGISAKSIFIEKSRVSSKKTRIISKSNNQQMLRMDDECIEYVNKNYEKKMIKFVADNIKRFDLVILSDYAKGILTSSLLTEVIKLAKINNKPIIVDPKGVDYSKYKGSTAILPNNKEAEEASSIKIKDLEDIKKACMKLMSITNSDLIVITLGDKGISLYKRGSNLIHLNAHKKEVFDVTGAGDTVISVFGLSMISGLSYEESLKMANIAAGIVVGKVEASSVNFCEILDYILGENKSNFNKLLGLKTLKSLVNINREVNRKIVFTNGCFDILHVGHIELLKRAKSFGDILILGLNSDKSIKKIKGYNRPILKERDRIKILSAIEYIDFIVLFDDETPLKIIKEILPDFLVKGSDYKREDIVGADIVIKNNGKVKVIQLIKDMSTTKIIDKIRKDGI